jgi:hypothetical protein
MPKDPVFLFDSVLPGGVLVNLEDVYAACIAALLVVVLSLFFQKTSTGRALRAVADELAEVSFLVQQKAGIADADDLRMYLTTAQKALDDFLTLSGAK